MQFHVYTLIYNHLFCLATKLSVFTVDGLYAWHVAHFICSTCCRVLLKDGMSYTCMNFVSSYPSCCLSTVPLLKIFLPPCYLQNSPWNSCFYIFGPLTKKVHWFAGITFGLDRSWSWSQCWGTYFRNWKICGSGSFSVDSDKSLLLGL